MSLEGAKWVARAIIIQLSSCFGLCVLCIRRDPGIRHGGVEPSRGANRLPRSRTAARPPMEGLCNVCTLLQYLVVLVYRILPILYKLPDQHATVLVQHHTLVLHLGGPLCVCTQFSCYLLYSMLLVLSYYSAVAAPAESDSCLMHTSSSVFSHASYSSLNQAQSHSVSGFHQQSR